MSALYPLAQSTYLSVFMIFLRLLGLFLIVPGYSHKSVPMNVKALLALVVSFALFPLLKPVLLPLPTDTVGIVLYVLREASIGFLMGFIAFVTFEAIHLAAQFIGYQMGFGTVGLIDPVNQANVSPIVPFTGWLALMIFFVTSMHHHVLELVVKSFALTHSLEIDLIGNRSLFAILLETTSSLFVIAVKIAAPFTLLVLACNSTVGILSRLLPQMHVILFTFPITILFGLATLYVFAPELLSLFEDLMGQMLSKIVELLRVF